MEDCLPFTALEKVFQYKYVTISFTEWPWLLKSKKTRIFIPYKKMDGYAMEKNIFGKEYIT